MFSLKRAYEPAEEGDGFRVLVDGLWPRGVSKGKAKIGLWLKKIAPSAGLRKWFGHDPARWAGFARRYRGELASNAEPVARLRGIEREKGRVTLVFAAKDTERNNAAALLSFLRK
jgi:uncharacterized protein YeaO (DUF488 family)